MRLKISQKNIVCEGLKKINNSNCHVYFKGYVIFENTLYVDHEFQPKIEELWFSNKLKAQISNFNGQFLLVVKCTDYVMIANDRYGFIPLYYVMHNDELIYSTQWREIIKFTPKTYDYSSLIEYITFGHVLGNKTLLKEIKEIAPHTIILHHLENEQLKSESISYWELKHHFGDHNIKRKEKEFASLWNEQIQIYTEAIKSRGNQVFIPLSSGLDSRLLAYEFNKANTDIYASTWSSHSSFYELESVKRLAALLNNLKHHSIVTLNYETVRKMIDSPNNYNRITSARMPIETYLYASYGCDIPFFIPGFSGDFMAGSHIFYRMKYWKNKQQLKDYIFKFKLTPLVKNIVDDKTFKEIIDQTLESTIPDCKDYISAFIRWDLEQRQRKYVVRSSNFFPRTTQLLPFFDYQLIDFFLDLPFDALLNTKLYINAQLKYIYTNKEFKRIKRGVKVQKSIRNNFLYEYHEKLNDLLRSSIYKNQQKFNNWDINIPWNTLISTEKLPKELQKYPIDLSTTNGSYQFFVLNLQLFNLELQSL